MQARIKHILLVCSDARESTLLQDLISNLYATVHITVAATSAQLAKQFPRITPDLIIIRADSEEKNTPRFLEKIRKNKKLDDIPVFVYTSMPGKKDLHNLLKK